MSETSRISLNINTILQNISNPTCFKSCIPSFSVFDYNIDRNAIEEADKQKTNNMLITGIFNELEKANIILINPDLIRHYFLKHEDLLKYFPEIIKTMQASFPEIKKFSISIESDFEDPSFKFIEISMDKSFSEEVQERIRTFEKQKCFDFLPDSEADIFFLQRKLS